MTTRDCKIHVLTENTVNRKGLLGEHGLSFLIETGHRRILFDTGQGIALAHNASSLGIDLQTIDTIVLSHGHYDHTGGLNFFKHHLHPLHLLAHPSAFEPKYAKNDRGDMHSVGIMPDLALPVQVQYTITPTEIMEKIWVTGPIPRSNELEHFSGPFFLDREGKHPDPLLDDQSIFIKTKNGIAVLLGCAHAGLINTLNYIQSLANGQPIETVIGGMHLLRASEERIQWTMRQLLRFNLITIAPCHCTGASAKLAMHGEYKTHCCDVEVGIVFDLELE